MTITLTSRLVTLASRLVEMELFEAATKSWGLSYEIAYSDDGIPFYAAYHTGIAFGSVSLGIQLGRALERDGKQAALTVAQSG